MKKQMLIICILLSLVLSGCGNSTSKNEVTKNPILSEGVHTIAQKVVDDYNSYISVKISKDDLLKKIKDYQEQAKDISDNAPEDYDVIKYMSELEKMLENNIAHKDNYELPINDIKTLLSGKTVKKIDTEWKLHQFNDTIFYLPKEYDLISSDDSSDIIQTYSYGENFISITSTEKKADVFTYETFEDCIKEFNEGTDYNLSTKMGIYFSRNCNFFYKTNGTRNIDDVSFNVKFYTCLDSDEMIIFLFYSTGDFDETVIKTILDDALII